MEYKSVSHLITNLADKHGNRVAMRHKSGGQWVEIRWPELDKIIHNASSALIELGVNELDTVGIFSQNRPEWSIADLASVLIRAVPAPIYPTNTGPQAEYIINDAEIKVLFVGGKDQLSKALEFFEKNRFLEQIVVLDPAVELPDHEKVISFVDFLALGEKSAHFDEVQTRADNATPEDLLTLIYTSGTTGEPKGVMIPHSNILHQFKAHSDHLLPVGYDDVSLCFLPLSHVFERIWSYNVFIVGAVNVYLEDPKEIINFIAEVKPTVMCAVPRFYEKIYAAVFDKLESASPVKRQLFKWAVAVGHDYHVNKRDKQPSSLSLTLKYKIADKLVLSKICGLVGGRIRFFPCAGAPLSAKIEEFFYSVGLFVCYGYGLTESTATTTCHLPHNFQFGAVGKPIPGVDVKIDPKNGEVLIKGGNIMKGYYKKPQATQEVFTEDGYFRTGDVGEFADNGELIITDRIKDLMKTSGGKYIAPVVIETAVGADHYVEQLTVIGDQRKFVSALIVPAFETLEEWAKNNGIQVASREELVSHPEVIAFYKKRIQDDCSQLANFEKIKNFVLLPKEFTVDSGEITPTLKVKRNIIIDKYNDVIDTMYAK